MPVEATATFRHKASTFSDTLDHQPDRSFGEGFSRIHELTGHRSGTDILQSLRATPRIDGKMSTSEALNQHRASTALATPITGNQVSAMLYMLVNRDRERGRETAIQAHIYIYREREKREDSRHPLPKERDPRFVAALAPLRSLHRRLRTVAGRVPYAPVWKFEGLLFRI